MNRKNSARKGARRKYQVEMTSLSLFLWISCLSLFLGWVFVLGILVGRGFIPDSVTEISDLLNKFQEMVSHGKKPDPESVKKEDYDGRLAFYNELLKRKEADRGREVPEAKSEPQRRDSLQRKNAATEERLAEIRAEVSGKEATGQKKTDRPPEVHPKERQASSTRGAFTLQVASLEEKSKAEETMRKLIKRGYDAYIHQVELRGKPWYRIRSGRFSTREEAEEFAGKVVRETGLKGLVTKIE